MEIGVGSLTYDDHNNKIVYYANERSS